MKCFRADLAALSIVLVVFTGFQFQAQTTGSQANSQTKPVAVDATKPPLTTSASVPDPEKLLSRPTSSSALKLAAARNDELSATLKWEFGGKRQTGWFLYRALIGKLLGTESDVASQDFAQALSTWQVKSGLTPSGILDEDTWYAIISSWQEARIKDRSFAQPSQLLVAPAADFWNPTRPEELRQVERETYAAYQRMLAAAIADPSLHLMLDTDGRLAPDEDYFKILSSFRSRDYQEKLRRETPGAGRAGLAVNSPHFTGRALDIYVGGDPVETRDSNRAIQVTTPVYRWLVRNAERFGFKPYFYEPWHWEYVR
jgi:LAS superfamily LD-carboxypeptidase LdcB